MKYDFNFKQIVEAANDVVIVTTADIELPGPKIVYVNSAFTELTGYTKEEAEGNNPRMLQYSETDRASLDHIRNALKSYRPVRTQLQNVSKDGTSYWLDLNIIPLFNDEGRVTHFAAIERDITRQKTAELKLQEKVKYDELTKLLVRAEFEAHLKEKISELHRYGDIFSVIMMDLDHFKEVNDQFGHAAGDEVLRKTADACRLIIRDSDKVGRIGGEEFCILLPSTLTEPASEVAERIRRNIEQLQFDIDSNTFSITASFGVAQISEKDTAESVLKKADQNLYEAKSSGRNQVKA